jgi:hypothetical protein
MVIGWLHCLFLLVVFVSVMMQFGRLLSACVWVLKSVKHVLARMVNWLTSLGLKAFLSSTILDDQHITAMSMTSLFEL